MIIRNTLIILILTMVHCCAQKESVRYSKSELETIVKKYMNQAYKYNVGSQYYFNEMDKAIQNHPNIAYFWQQYAMPLFKQRKYELGMQYLDKAVALSPEEYLDYRAFIKCIFSKQYREAIQDFEKAIELYGNQHVMDHSYQFYIALCYLQLSEFEKAKNLLEPEIQENIKNHGSDWIHHSEYFYLGIAHYELGNYVKAIENFDAAIQSYPQFPDAIMFKSETLKKLNKEKDAKEYYDLALKFANEGFTINESNSIYEMYPYQINWAFYK